jgi:nucleoside-diphosphate-sugar epimerase
MTDTAPIALVTGSSGFIGRHVVRALLQRGYTVRTLRRSSSTPSKPRQSVRWPWLTPNPKPVTEDPPIGRLEAVRGDLTPDDVTRAATGARVVYHLGGLTRAATEAEFMWANAEGTRAAALGAARAGARLVYVSSLAAAGPGTPSDPRRETDPPAPITTYGRSKLEGERRVTEVAGLIPLAYSIIRPPGVYGPGDKDFLFAFQAAKFGVFPILGDPERAYTLVFVHDLVRGIIEAGERPEALGKTYFLGHAEPVRWGGILEMLARLFDKPYRPLPLPNAALELAANLGEAGQVFGRVGLINKSRQRDLTAPGWVCDSSRIQTDLGITAPTGLEQGFRDTRDWYAIQGWI